MPHWLTVSLVMALLGLDVVAVGQFMLSRPIVVGPLIGWLTGRFDLGVEMGALMELIWIGDVPVGSHMPLDLLTLVGVAVAYASELSLGPEPDKAVMTFAIAVAIPLAVLSTAADNYFRKFHLRWAHFAQRMAAHGHFRTFEWVNAFVLIEIFLRGFLMTVICLWVAHWTSGFFKMLPPKVIDGLYDAHWLLLALGCSAVIDLLVEKKNAVYLGLAILVVGTAALLQVPGVYLVGAVVSAGLVLTLLFIGKGEASHG